MEKVFSGMATFLGYIIALAMLGILAAAAFGVFAWIVFQVSGLLFGGS